MPTYDYRCDANGRTLEARHPMQRALHTWGELCELLGMDPGDTPARAPVRKLITGTAVMQSANLGSGTTPPCQGGTGPSCGRGSCGM